MCALIINLCVLHNVCIVIFNRADTWVRPYIYPNVFPNAMEMVGHDDHFVTYFNNKKNLITFPR